jgi:RNA polymerase sigma-70 factor (ECF subfamily)
MLGAVIERLLKALRRIHPRTARQFFALTNRHVRWELNDLVRGMDARSGAVELREDLVPAPRSDESDLSPEARRMLDTIDRLPEEEREVFDLVRLRGLTNGEAADMIGVSAKTVQRRLRRGLYRLRAQLSDLRPAERVSGGKRGAERGVHPPALHSA